MTRKIYYSKSALPLILESLGIENSIPHEKILGICKNEDGATKVITNQIDLFLEIEKRKEIMKKKFDMH